MGSRKSATARRAASSSAIASTERSGGTCRALQAAEVGEGDVVERGLGGQVSVGARERPARKTPPTPSTTRLRPGERSSSGTPTTNSCATRASRSVAARAASTCAAGAAGGTLLVGAARSCAMPGDPAQESAKQKSALATAAGAGGQAYRSVRDRTRRRPECAARRVGHHGGVRGAWMRSGCLLAVLALAAAAALTVVLPDVAGLRAWTVGAG